MAASLPRRVTRGPLDIPDDPLGTSTPTPASPSQSQSQLQSPLTSRGTSPSSYPTAIHDDPSQVTTSNSSLKPPEKDFSYLLRPEIYHPLSQLEIPPPFRSHFPSPSKDEPLSTSLATLDSLLAKGNFLPAAHLSATLLNSPSLSPTDSSTTFSLLQTRLSCLELTGNTLLAAQEAKALEDLSSAFYYTDSDISTNDETQTQIKSHHIVPWSLRVLAVRLQSIGFGDARRGVAGFYDLGLEARAEIQRPGATSVQNELWRARLADLGIRVVNALIEMGDLEAGRRGLENMIQTHQPADGPDEIMTTRLVLLELRIGDVNASKKLLESLDIRQSSNINAQLLPALLSMAEGRYTSAVREFRSLLSSLDPNTPASTRAMITQNLAVALLYTGELSEARSLLENLIDGDGELGDHGSGGGHSFHSMTFNLSTIYELCSDKPRSLKMKLAERVAKQPRGDNGDRGWERGNGDFKL